MTTKRKTVSLLTICFVAYQLILYLQGCTTPAQETSDSPVQELSQKFVGSQNCQSCHAKEFADWKKSDHFLAMQPANDSTVLGDFDNVTLISDGVKNRFFKKDGKYFIETQAADGKNQEFEVLYTFGHFPLQQYLIAFPGGRMQATRASWNSRDQKWFHQYPGQKIHHGDWLHWTGNAQNWNTMCASCHSTDLKKNYDFNKEIYATTWSEVSVGCESCHGAGNTHINFVQSASYKDGDKIKNSGLSYGKELNASLQIKTCAPCHARKSDIAATSLQTTELLDDMIPQIITNEFYFADGQLREEDYEYGSFTQSKMYQNNVQCANCHNPHSGKLNTTGNNLCMSCHEPKYNTREHHFHGEETEGAQCINCHMQVKTFMGNDHRRDHSFRRPRPDQSVVFGTPNACNNCHQNKSPDWAAISINKWFGPKRAYHFSDDLIPGSQLKVENEHHLLKLLADTLQPEIARATSAFYLGNYQTQNSVDALLNSIHDKKALVRFHAVRALENFDAELWREAAISALTDKVRAVRIAAASLYHRLPEEEIPAHARSAYQSANAENRKYLQYQTDFSVGNVMLADYALQEQDHLKAINLYIRGLKKDSLMNYARLNLSAAYNSVGKNREALNTLNDAVAIDPSNPRIFYNLGLLYYELGEVNKAIDSFQKAVKLGSTDTGLYYNFGLLLQQQGQVKAAEELLLKGHLIDPSSSSINYALAYLYLQQNNRLAAKRHVEILFTTDHDNPDYQSFFKTFGLMQK
jgi:predicted CXXCH cytochrome family protein